jgi:hypothetical protein
MNGIYSLYNEISQYGTLSADYVDKMLHHVPKTAVIDRVDYLLKETAKRVVLDLGASGPIVQALQQVAREYYGADIVSNPAIRNFHQIDFDKAMSLPSIPSLQLIVAGEIIEHLSNAGRFLDLLHKSRVPVILTTPNAGGIDQQRLVRLQTECVNREHVAWYSYNTLKTLIERHNFKLIEWYWYNGQPLTAEGLIFKIEPVYGAD